MKKIALIAFVACVVVGLCLANFFSFGRWTTKLPMFSANFGGVSGSGKVATDKRNVSNFDSIEVSGVFQVEITSGKDFNVEVQADDNLLALIKTEVQGSTLNIQLDKGVSTKNGLIVRISAPNIKKIEASSAAKVNASGFGNDSLAVELSGASKMTASGETKNLSVEVSGASNVDAGELKAVNAKVAASGASHVDVNVSGELHSEATGASRIVYSGDPTSTDNHQSGAGSVSRK